MQANDDDSQRMTSHRPIEGVKITRRTHLLLILGQRLPPLAYSSRNLGETGTLHLFPDQIAKLDVCRHGLDWRVRVDLGVPTIAAFLVSLVAASTVMRVGGSRRGYRRQLMMMMVMRRSGIG